MITRLESGRWRADIRLPTGVRRRKSFRTKAEAQQFIHFCKSQRHDSPWLTQNSGDDRRLSQLINLWFDLHGRSLLSGSDRKARLLHVCRLLGDPVAFKLSSDRFVRFRAERLDAGISESTCNHDLAHLRALFQELHRLGQIDYPSPLSKVRQLKVPPAELRFLSKREILLLLDAVDPKTTRLVMKVCLSVGARWSEAQGLAASDLVGPNRLRFLGKNNKYRFLPVSQDLFRELHDFLEEGCFPRTCYDDFRRAVQRCGIDLPDGQLTHVLRHTFATTYLSRTSDLRGLQSILDHSNISVTSRYLHALPGHAGQVIDANPLTLLEAE